MRVLAITAAALLYAGAAFAQSAVQNPSQPGSGYKIPETPQTGAPTTSGVPAPGQNPNAPGAGFKIPEKGSVTAPAAPATNDQGNLPKGSKQQ